MIRRAKRFVVFMLLSFFFVLLVGNAATVEARSVACLVPKSGDKLKYDGAATNISAEAIAEDVCY